MMKKILSIFTLLVALVSCSGGSKYTINGTINGAIDGDTVLLGYSLDGSDFITEQKTTIEGGKFQFSGKVDGSKIYYIGYNYTEPPIYSLLFLEGGNITTEVSPEGSITTGTPANDLNAKIEKDLLEYVNTIYDCQIQIYEDTTLSDTTKARLSLLAMEAQRDASLYIKEVINDNITSIVGMFLLVQYADLFDNDELSRLVGSIPEEIIDRDNNCIYDILCEIKSERENPHPSEDSTDNQVENALEQAINETMIKE
ncbi:MAG: DUF4369 domain-containing protein [Bacteroidaceae bacterium]|nr:DUF4369 domain-containing protein [Bacteroidaceae bacterium]